MLRAATILQVLLAPDRVRSTLKGAAGQISRSFDQSKLKGKSVTLVMSREVENSQGHPLMGLSKGCLVQLPII